MKILCVHNYYGSQSPSGENTVFDSEVQLLREHGHEVIEYTRHSDDIRQQGGFGTLKGGVSVPWNPFSLRQVRGLIEKAQPDVMHIHNTFPLISPSVFYAASGTKTATVLTLHNYRLFCANALLLRNDKPCTRCLDQKSVVSALKYGCYRDSRLATMPLAVSTVLHRKLKTWQKQVDAFISLTEFQRSMVLKAGLPSEAIYVKPHFYPDPPAPIERSFRENKAIFIGRLGPEKGVRLLLDAWEMWGSDAPHLEIIGSGLEKAQLQQRSVALGLNNKISFLGQISFQETQSRLQRAKMLLLPSLCFEGFPMVIREAFALGVPVVASRLGAMACLIEEQKNGLLFETGNAFDLLSVLKKTWMDQDNLAKMGEVARDTFESQYTANANYNILMDIYRAASSSRRTL
ncbi:MAG: glycosyltransferase family 4 protein [Legionellaceae bacterium]|nr:glycosyltransferase family 4 protein [Legionellaceae bacterium]